jgi:GTPase SAR1 family protein
MINGNNLKNYKVALMGDSGVGKTSIVNRYTKNTFDSNILTTTGVCFFSKNLFFPETNESCKLDVIKNKLFY